MLIDHVIGGSAGQAWIRCLDSLGRFFGVHHGFPGNRHEAMLGERSASRSEAVMVAVGFSPCHYPHLHWSLVSYADDVSHCEYSFCYFL
jgi:hypothetical protein